MDQNLVQQCPARRFYVYAFFRKDDGTPYYIGKGEGQRINRSAGRRFKLPPKDQRKILVGGLTEPESFEYEIALISLLGRKDLGTGCLRNLTDGGDGMSGHVFSAEHRAKIGAASKGRTPSPEIRAKISAAQQGRIFSPEHRAKISAANSNPKAETRAKMSAANKGRKHSPEARAKISAAARNPSPERRAKIGAASKGRVFSPEQRAKISAANKGRVFSPEHRANLRTASAARWAAKRALRETTSGQLTLLSCHN